MLDQETYWDYEKARNSNFQIPEHERFHKAYRFGDWPIYYRDEYSIRMIQYEVFRKFALNKEIASFLIRACDSDDTIRTNLQYFKFPVFEHYRRQIDAEIYELSLGKTHPYYGCESKEEVIDKLDLQVQDALRRMKFFILLLSAFHHNIT